MIFSLIICNTISIFAFDFTWDLGGIGFESMYDINNEEYAFGLNLRMLNLFLDNEKSSIGLQIVPISYSYSKYYNGHVVSFANIILYWNLLPFFYEYNAGISYRFGPFVSVSPLNFTNFHFGECIINTGLIITAFEIFDIEIGYKYLNNNDRHSVYINLNTRFVGFLVFAMFGASIFK